MIIQIFSVFDSKAAAFTQPFFSHNLVTGIRAFSDVCQDASHTFAKHPEDFSLFHLGSFDDQSGLLEPFAAPENLGLARQFTNKD